MGSKRRRIMRGLGLLLLSFPVAHVYLTMRMLSNSSSSPATATYYDYYDLHINRTSLLSTSVGDRSVLLLLSSSSSSMLPSINSTRRSRRSRNSLLSTISTTGSNEARSKTMIKETKMEERIPHSVVAYNNHTFPRWGPEGIDLQGAVLEFIIKEIPNQDMNRFYEIPKIPYFFDQNGVWVGKAIRNNKTPKHQIRHRILPSEQALLRAWKHLMMTDTNTSNYTTRRQKQKQKQLDRWPLLRRAVTTKDGGHGFPMIVWQADFQSCNYNNYNYNTRPNKKQKKRKRNRSSSMQQQQEEVVVSSVPIFTTCAQVSCGHAFPLPTYETIELSQPTSKDWDAIFRTQSLQYPWQTKIRKVVWRGSLSGPLLNYQSPRSRIAMFAAALQHADNNRHHNNTDNNNATSSLFDIGLHNIPQRHYNPQTNQLKRSVNVTKLGGLVPPIPQSDFSKYIAILDTDGNSWSSRFGRLLCSNSLIVKVEPHFVDSFYKYLTPWKHYVPVQYDLSDLQVKAEWILDFNNEAAVLQIVAAANDFCKRHMTHQAISEDILDILNAYVGYLDLYDYNHDDHSSFESAAPALSSNSSSIKKKKIRSWRTKWKAAKARLLKDPALGMEKLSERNRGLL